MRRRTWESVRSFLYAAERSRCYRISLDGEPPNLINPDRKLCSAGTADPTSCCMRPLSSDEDDEDPLFYPMEMETEARIIKSFSGSSSDDGAATGSGTQKRVPQDLATIPEAESENLPMDLPEPSADDLSNLPDLDPNTSEPVEKRNANLTEYLPDLQQNPSEPVEKYPVEAELENSPCAETEKNIDHIGTQNQKSRLEQTTDSELTLPDATIPETEGDEQLVNTEQKCSEPSDSFPQEQIEKGKVRTTLPGSVDLADSPQEVRSFLYAAERSRCYRISLDGEPPNLINPDRKLCSAGTADPTSCCMVHEQHAAGPAPGSVTYDIGPDFLEITTFTLGLNCPPPVALLPREGDIMAKLKPEQAAEMRHY
ncbi:uncharacterized protein V6R79_022962 [Siganus canaliculatus]